MILVGKFVANRLGKAAGHVTLHIRGQMRIKSVNHVPQMPPDQQASKTDSRIPILERAAKALAISVFRASLALPVSQLTAHKFCPA
jgi:hypothetical protein